MQPAKFLFGVDGPARPGDDETFYIDQPLPPELTFVGGAHEEFDDDFMPDYGFNVHYLHFTTRSQDEYSEANLRSLLAGYLSINILEYDEGPATEVFHLFVLALV